VSVGRPAGGWETTSLGRPAVVFFFTTEVLRDTEEQRRDLPLWVRPAVHQLINFNAGRLKDGIRRKVN